MENLNKNPILNKCWGENCSKKALIENQSGYRYCIEHFFWYRKYDHIYFTKFKKFLFKNLIKTMNQNKTESKWEGEVGDIISKYQVSIENFYYDEAVKELVSLISRIEKEAREDERKRNIFIIENRARGWLGNEEDGSDRAQEYDECYEIIKLIKED